MKKPPAKSPVERRANMKRRKDDQLLPDFQDLVDNSVQGILVHRNFKPLYANAAFAEILGYNSAEEILALPLIKPIVPADLWARAEETYSEMIRTKESPRMARMRALRKDGREIWLSITQRPIDWHGKPAAQVGVFDISDQMAIEQVLLMSEQHLRSILEILPYPIYITRRDDRQLLFVNRKTCLMFQKSANQLLKGTSSEFFADPQELADLRVLLDTLHDVRDVEVKMKTSQGREFTAEVAAIAIEYSGQPALLVALNDITQRKQLEADLFREASTDSLTGISNRRYFLAQAEQEMRRTRRFGRDMSAMMIDLDHFKAINDKYGHAGGDAILQGVVKASLESLRQSDLLGRLGGEEFAVILPETSLQAASEVANRLCQNIAERPIIVEVPGAGLTAVHCTVSVGIAQLITGDGSIDTLLNRADEALYRAKKNGRNRVETAV